jgi:UDP-N-acetylmuramate-alanine ligase
MARLTKMRCEHTTTRFVFEGVEFALPQAGRMNAANAAAVTLACRHWGISPRECAAALADFPGALGRQTLLREDEDLVLVSDTAYHPNAVRHLLRALRDRYQDRRLCLVLQPRHTSGAANWQQKLWPPVLGDADLTLLTEPLNPHGDTSNRFSSEVAAREATAKGAPVLSVGPPEAAGELFDKLLRRGDVWVLCLADWFEQPRARILQFSETFP